jgi:hypothetical protein
MLELYKLVLMGLMILLWKIDAVGIEGMWSMVDFDFT